MCVIIAKKLGETVPYDMLDSACVFNSDGFGILTYDRGKIEAYKEFTKDGNDPEKIAKLLEDCKNVQTYLHLRLRSSGNKGLDSCHPFKLATKKDDGFDLYLMHNGTMHDYDKGNDDLPDSYHFGMEVAQPVYEMFFKTYDEDNFDNGSPLTDDLFQKLIQSTVPSYNKILLLDDTGTEFIANKKTGVEFPWGWASNNTYFRDVRRHSFRPAGRYWDASAGRFVDTPPFQEESLYPSNNVGYPTDEYLSTRSSASKGRTTATTVNPDTRSKSEQEQALEKTTSQVSDSHGKASNGVSVPRVPAVVPFNDPLPSNLSRRLQIPNMNNRPQFSELHPTVKILSDLFSWEYDDFYQLVTTFPDKSVALIMDMLCLLYKNKEFKLKEAGDNNEADAPSVTVEAPQVNTEAANDTLANDKVQVG
jgi:hypothetical protein